VVETLAEGFSASIGFSSSTCSRFIKLLEIKIFFDGQQYI